MTVAAFISIVVPVHNEASQLRHFFEVCDTILNEFDIAREFIFVDDGSSDSSWEILSSLAEQHEGLVLVRLSRNFGKESAITAGLDAATGDAVVVIDADMQHPPALIPEFVRLWRQDGYKVVEAIKNSRGNENWLKKNLSLAFYGFMSRVAGLNMKGGSDFRLMDKEVVTAIRSFPERVRFFRGISTWVGFRRTTVTFDVAPRMGGDSNWNIISLIRLAVNAITSFSSIPLYLITIVGVFMMLFSLVLGVQTFAVYLTDNAVDGFTTVILLQLIIGACSMFGLGVLGIYVARLYEEVKARPQYIVEKRLSSSKRANPHDDGMA